MTFPWCKGRANRLMNTGRSKLSIIIPCFNERHTLREIVQRAMAVPLPSLDREIVIVDDASTDGSREIILELAEAHPEIRTVFHDRNRGKGAAIRSGQSMCAGDMVVIQDADLEYDPNNYTDLLRPILEGKADVVYGSRFMGGRARRTLLFWHSVANRLLTVLSNMTTNLNVTDMMTCYKVFVGAHFRAIPLQSDGFGIEAELTAKVAKLDLRLYEVPIDYHGRTYAAGKKIGWRDGLAVAFTILRYWLTDGLGGVDEGLETLQAVRHARRYNRYLFRKVDPFVGDRVLEAGAGIGNITVHLLHRELVIVGDLDTGYIQRLRQIFGANPNVEPRQMDLTMTEAYDAISDRRLDSVVCLNVLEHLSPDREVLGLFHRVLQPGGTVVVLVPAGRWLYGTIDRALGHVRRYSRRELRAKLEEAGFEVLRTFAVNRVAPIGWWLNGRILRRKALPAFQMRLFDLVVFLLPVLDRVLPIPPLSIVAVGRKSGAPAEVAGHGM